MKKDVHQNLVENNKKEGRRKFRLPAVLQTRPFAHPSSIKSSI